MEKKQTAVEWLVEQIEKDENVRLRGLNIRNLLEQAKQMEKEQHEETWASAWNESAKSGDFEKYYNETFGGNNANTTT